MAEWMPHLLAILVLIAAGVEGRSQTKPHAAAPHPVAAVPASPSDEIIAEESTYNKYFVQGNLVELKKLMSVDFATVQELIWNRDQLVDFVKQMQPVCHFFPIKIVEPTEAFLSPDVATIVYHAPETASCSGRTIAGNVNISSVWVKRDGRWQLQLHTENADLPGL